MVAIGVTTATKTIVIIATREWSHFGNNGTGIVICVELSWMVRLVVVPVVVRIATLRRQGIKMQQHSTTRWEATLNALVYGSCGVSQ